MTDEARAVWSSLVQDHPGSNEAQVRASYPFAQEAELERFVAALFAAGMRHDEGSASERFAPVDEWTPALACSPNA